MDILDIRILEGKDINTIMQFTENLKSQNLEGIINAHNIYDVMCYVYNSFLLFSKYAAYIAQ